MELVNHVREDNQIFEIETKGLESRKRVEQAKKSDEV